MNQNIKSAPQSHSVLAFTGVIAGCLLISFSGCRSLNSTFGSGTNDGMKLPKLAFWNKGNETPPPPPAHHLSPSSTQAFGQLAEKADRADGAISDMEQGIDQITKSARSRVENFAATGASRAPYSANGSGIDKATEALRSKFNASQKEFGQGLAQAKGKLKSLESNAIADSKTMLSNQFASAQQGIDQSFKSAADLRGASNDFKATIAQKNAQLKSEIESAIERKPFDPALAKVNKSLYDMKGNLVSARSGSSKSFSGTAEEARERFSAALGTLNGEAAMAAKSTSDLGTNLKNRIASTASELKQSFRPDGAILSPSFKKSNDPVSDQARGLLQQAKQKVAGLGTGFDFPEPQSEPLAPTRLGNQLRSMASTFGNASGTQPAQGPQPRPFSGGDFARTRVANVTPIDSQGRQGKSVASALAGLSGAQTGLGATLNHTWNNGERPSQLKPIEVATPGNILRTASLQVKDLGRSAAIPGHGNARNVTVGHVSDIVIPQKVLSGSGSYAPGSVNKVR